MANTGGFSKFMIHFPMVDSPETLNNLLTDFLVCLWEQRAWQDAIFRTGDSKREALKHETSLADRGAVAKEMNRVVSAKNWPRMRTLSYWAPSDSENDRHHLMFNTHPFAFVWKHMMSIDIPERRVPAFERALVEFERRYPSSLVIYQFGQPGSEVTRATDGRGIWYDPRADSENFLSLMKRIGREVP